MEGLRRGRAGGGRARPVERHDLTRDGRFALQSFPQPKPGSDEFYIGGSATLVDDPIVRAEILRDAKHMADPSEIVFEWRAAAR